MSDPPRGFVNRDHAVRALAAYLDVSPDAVLIAPNVHVDDIPDHIDVSVHWGDLMDANSVYVTVEPAHARKISTPSPELMRVLLGETVPPLDLDYDDRYLNEIDTDIALEREWQGRLRAERQTQAWKHPQPRPDPTAILDEQ